MNPASKPRSGGREARPSVKHAATGNKQTPSTDMQAEDVGTAASGNGARGTAVQGAMKQTSKTESERGSR